MEKGDKFGRLTFTGIEFRYNKRLYGLFVCECGTAKLIRMDGVAYGGVKSCGCLYRERLNTVGLDSRTYELLYNVWSNMIKRCYDEKSDRFYAYGARGVCVCDEWKNNFRAFAMWAVCNGWNTGLSIERKDVTKDYEPSNCTFITMKEQARNKTNNVVVEYNGQKKCLAEWCELLALPYKTIWMRLRRNPNMDIKLLFYDKDLRSVI